MSTELIIGCTFEELHGYLAKSFYTKYNRCITDLDEIHIDHIKPICLAKTEQEMIELNHYTNLRWLLAEDNLKKGATYE